MTKLQKTCKRCQQAFELDDLPIVRGIPFCPPCAEARLKEHDQQRFGKVVAERRAEWEAICPLDYIDLSPTLLPYPGVFSKVIAWEYGKRGLILNGPSRRGKSRCAWALLQRQFLNFNRSVMALDSDAGLRYAAMYSDSPVYVEEWFDNLLSAKIVLLDDVFKAKLTDSFEQIIFALIEKRMQNQRPIIVTCNDNAGSLKARLSPDRADPLIGRLADCCTPIEF